MVDSKSVDASLWWDSFTLLFTELENSSLSTELPQNLAKKLKDNHAWFLNTVSLFKTPNEKSREALNSQKLQIGSHQLTIQPELKDKALQISSYLQLDEVQSYILAVRSIKHNNVAADSLVQEFLHMVLIQYYMERQCLMKCVRWILMHAIYIGAGSKTHIIEEEARKLFHDGLESKLLSFFEDLLSSSYPQQMSVVLMASSLMNRLRRSRCFINILSHGAHGKRYIEDVDLFTLWAEETLIEDNLVLDILFLAYYDSFCTFSGEKWEKLCSFYKGILSGHYNFGKLAITSEAQKLSYHAKVQLLLILIETLDLENLLQMVHDEIPYRKGVSAFSLSDIQEMDAVVSTFSAFEMKEAGPLILAWAVFLCLILTLPGKDDNNELMEIDHSGYVRQVFDAGSLSYCLEFLQCDLLKEYDGPVSGYRSVLRTFISAFIASYEINLQQEDSNPTLILDIICNIYRGEESLCVQFWDKESFIDGPIRCLLCNLESEFPLRKMEFVQLLSSLCEGTWPAECVYNFLDRSVGISSVFEISTDSLADDVAHVVEAKEPVQVPGIEGFIIPAGTRGRVLKVLGDNTALVRWECAPSGVSVLLLHLAQEMYLDGRKEILFTLDLLSRLVFFNISLCSSLIKINNSIHFNEINMMNEQVEESSWVVRMICNLVKNLSLNSHSAALMSMGIKILGKMLICSPSQVAVIALNTRLFDITLQTTMFSVANNGLSSGSWMLSEKLARMLLIDCEQNSNDCPLAISVLDFTIQLVETGLENDAVHALVVFSLQYVLVNHEYWKYKVKHIRWRITLKVLELMKRCIISMSYYGKLGEIIEDVVFSDSSIHSTLFRIICTTSHALEKLHVSRLFDPMEIEGLHLAISYALDVLFIMLSKVSKDTMTSFPVFHQAVFSCSTKPVPVVTAAISLISYFPDPAIQFGAVRVASMVFAIADSMQPFLYGTTCFAPDDKQISDLRDSLSYILLEQLVSKEDLFVAAVNLLTSAARYQSAFLVALFASEENNCNHFSIVGDAKQKKDETPLVSKKLCLMDTLLHYIERADDLIKSNPRILLSVLNLMNSLWQGAPQYTNLLESLRISEEFWKQLSNGISEVAGSEASLLDNLTEKAALNLAYSYQCQSAILEIMAYELFLQKKLLLAKSLARNEAESKEKEQNALKTEKSKAKSFCDLKEIWSSWCKDSVLEKVIKSYTSSGYNNETYYRAKVATSLFTVHAMERLAAGDSGSLSVSLLQKIHVILMKLGIHPAFSELLSQYSQHGYSEGKELKKLIVGDLYYHIQGELEGRKIGTGPFKELSQYLIESSFLQTYQHRFNDDFSTTAKNVYLFDLIRLRADLGLDVWDCSEWKASKEVVETMLHQLQDANSVMLLSSSKLSALKALMAVLAVYHNDSMERNTTGERIPDELIFTCIEHICQSLYATVETLTPVLDASEHILNFLASQAELLLHLTRTVCRSLSLHISLLVLNCAGSSLKILSELKPSGAHVIMNLLLTLLLSVLESTFLNMHLGKATGKESVDDFSKVSNVTLGFLPILCKCIAASELCKLSLSVMDLILRNFLTPSTWLPVIQNHLQLQIVMLKLQDKTSFQDKSSSIPIIMKFFLTLARVKGGAEMLYCSGFLSSLRVLFAESGEAFPRIHSESLDNSYEKGEMPQNIWGLGLAVVTAMVQSLGDSSSCSVIVDSMIPYFFSEKAYLIFSSLNAPDLPSDDHDKKRPRAPRSHISLLTLKETENTLMLMCELAKHWNSWIKATKEVDRQLREKCIHLLAFISRGTQRLGELSSRNAPLLCPPTSKEDFDCCLKPSYVDSKSGWFALSPLGCISKPKVSFSTALTIYGPATESTSPPTKTYFSDAVAVQVYKIAFLLLRFLCLQAEGAARRAEEVGFVDLAHFPELPMPEILHGLQDQAIIIVTEVCAANKLKVSPEIQKVCYLLLRIVEMALHLELCVLQICGIRPVLGRVEDFAKEVKSLFCALEGHAFLKASSESLKQIISFVYPGLLQAEGFI